MTLGQEAADVSIPPAKAVPAGLSTIRRIFLSSHFHAKYFVRMGRIAIKWRIHAKMLKFCSAGPMPCKQ